jgi:hypothetical protein
MEGLGGTRVADAQPREPERKVVCALPTAACVAGAPRDARVQTDGGATTESVGAPTASGRAARLSDTCEAAPWSRRVTSALRAAKHSRPGWGWTR